MPKKMRKSRSVTIGLLGGVAAACVALGGCTRQRPAESWDQVCVDNNNIVADSRKCEEDQRARAGYPGYSPMYHWYYIHSPYGISGYYPLGSRVNGGAFSAPSGHGIAISRGGFGATGAGRSAAG